jgi:branched-chain amino acid transport system substrate-binding protein
MQRSLRGMTPEEREMFIEGEVQKDLSRRLFMKAGFGTLAAASLSGSFLAACAKGNDSGDASSGSGGDEDLLKVGVVAPFSGVGAFIGTIVNNSLNTAVKQLNATGGIGGRKVKLVLRDTGVDPANGPKAYTELSADPKIVGILWCQGAGFTQALPSIKRDGMPVISVFNDLHSSGKLYPAGDEAGRSVFQLVIPATFGMNALVDYAKNDRGYTSAAMITDTSTDPEGDNPKYFKAAMEKAGMEVKGIETFAITDSDYGAQLQRLKAAKPQTIWIWGLSANSAGIVSQLGDLGASYVDTPTAKAGGDWHPHVFGSPAGTGDKSWIGLAGDDAKVGTVTACHMGGLIFLPSFAIAGWMRKYIKKDPTGGEESPADGLAALLNGVKKAGSTDRAKVVEGLETMGKIKFASIPFGFSATNHLAKTQDEIIVVTMERGGTGPAPTDPPYKLGVEWGSGVFTRADYGPTYLVRPTLEANKRAHPEVMAEVLEKGYGTQCTKHPDGSLGKECKIH